MHTVLGELRQPVRPGDTARLALEEAVHLRALRLAAGDEICVTDGRGSLWRGVLEEAARDGARCRLRESVEAPPVLPVDLAFGVANRDRTLWLVEKAVELGVRSLLPVEFARSRSVADAGRAEGFRRKANRRAVAAMKQSGGAWLPRLHAPRTLAEFLEGATSDSSRAVRLLAAAGGRRRLADVVAAWPDAAEAALLVGPEGGLEPGEIEACRRSGFEPVTLGPRTLRFETAALVALSLLAQVVPASSAEERRRGGLGA